MRNLDYYDLQGPCERLERAVEADDETGYRDALREFAILLDDVPGSCRLNALIHVVWAITNGLTARAKRAAFMPKEFGE